MGDQPDGSRSTDDVSSREVGWGIRGSRSLPVVGLLVVVVVLVSLAHMHRYEYLRGGADGRAVWMWDRWKHEACFFLLNGPASECWGVVDINRANRSGAKGQPTDASSDGDPHSDEGGPPERLERLRELVEEQP